MSEETGKYIGCKIGNYIETDKRAWQSDQAKFMRIRVELQINKPLRRGGYITSLDGERIWITFKYERLPTICFICGRIGHDNKHCVATSDMQTKEHQYGDWIRANGSYRRSSEKVKTRNGSSNQSNGMGEMTRSHTPLEQTPKEGTRALAVEASEGTQKSSESQGIGKATSSVAQDDVGESGKQATSQLPRWDNSKKFVQNQEEMDYTHNL